VDILPKILHRWTEWKQIRRLFLTFAYIFL
jgi:hypothetical protein